MAEPLTVAVVGHTNAGKTSLLRTLTRDTRFGTISAQPGTTRHVEREHLLVEGRAVLALVDTPGFEDSVGLLNLLEELPQDRHTDGIELLELFCRHPSASGQFEQEAKIIGQLLVSDLIFYLIDARQPLLGKYRDELQILGYAARPVIPVLNFVAEAGDNIQHWRELLARLNFHASVLFDTVLYDFANEQQLFAICQTVLPEQAANLEQLKQSRRQHWHTIERAAVEAIAALLLDLAAFRMTVAEQEEALPSAIAAMQNSVRRAEQGTAQALVAIYQFPEQALATEALPVQNGLWKRDLFDRELLALVGIETSSAAAKGAAIGVGIDLMTGGLSLGAAAGTGAVVGTLWSGGRRFGADLLARFRGYRFLKVDAATLGLVRLRAFELLAELQRRGHAAQNGLAMTAVEAQHAALSKPLLRLLQQAANRPEWCQLGGRQSGDAGRTEHLGKIAAALKAD